ncbi:hypothetical protein BJ138DRAFT_1116252 [Hygrophoropsis aurantiaca]|uniref:Uncharacterized protein n=1 Tax=Hygrophoropsis aurantiaca TaxID=72124 RepID=A0ACB8A3B6_9AGAM|nr:hypothetical protein BJ138DRAFT_1116252 [Hygrophoropsis aurantiaca]
MYRQLVAFAAVSFAGFQGAFAQGNSAGVCLASTGYNWTVNSQNQDPCQVANDLFAADPCNQSMLSYVSSSILSSQSYTYPIDDVSYPPLTATTGPSSYYTGPQANQSTSCTCNTVIYSLASACGLCQNGTFLYWSEWTDNCYANDTVYQEWPASIPSDTTIPPWAYMPLVNGFWDGPQAEANASAVAQSSTSASSSTATSSTTSSAVTTSTAPASGGSSASTTSASAGPTGAGTGGAGKMSASVGGAFAGAFLLSFLGVL